MMPGGGALLEIALDLAQEAGELLVQRRTQALSVSTKSTPTDVVTNADREAEAHLAQRLSVSRPDDGLLGEEGAEREGTTGLRWVIDPLDGTVNYLYGLPLWSVSIAVEDVNGPLVGVVHAPALGETYTATRGGGAWRGGEALQVSECDRLDRVLLLTGFGYDKRRRAAQGQMVAELLPQIRDIRRLGSAALDLCWVASGRADAFAEQGLATWDGAAGGLIAAEAGAVVGGLRGRSAGPDLFVATAPGVWSALHDVLVALAADDDPLSPAGEGRRGTTEHC